MRPALTLCLAMLVWAAPAAAQEGLHVDPESPAGKEYALPLDSARREAQGKPGASPGAPKGDRAELFGEGITPEGGDGGQGGVAGGNASGGGGSSGGGDANGGSAEGGSKTKSAERGAAERLAVPASSSGGSAAATSVGIALGALLVAVGLGLGLRRVLR